MKLLTAILLVLSAVGISTTANCPTENSTAVIYTPADSVEITALLKSRPASTLDIAYRFIGRPYVAHTLETGDSEQLVVNTRQMDCTTLVETVTALRLCILKDLSTFNDYCNMLKDLRYREGIIDGYSSRLHYFAQWIEDNSKMGLVTEIQQEQAPFTAIQQLNIHYMSSHPDAYSVLRVHPEIIKIIEQQEKALTGRSYRFIPKKQVRNTTELRQVVKDGDIIAITCNKPGLDIAHIGFAVWKTDGLHLLNASQIHRKVVLEPMSLERYLAKHPSHTGIRIIRINQ